MNLYEVAEEIGRRLFKIFLKDEQGNRPFTGRHENSRRSPLARLPLFYEYYHGTVAWGLARATRRMVRGHRAYCTFVCVG